MVSIVGSGQYTVSAQGLVAIVAASAIDVHVALGYVVKNAGTGHDITEGGIAGTVAARAVLGRGEVVIDRVGIALARTCFLVYERLDACHDWCSKGRSACTRPCAGSTCTGSATICSIGVTKNIVVAPDAVPGEERDVWNVPHAVARIAEDRLP